MNAPQTESPDTESLIHEADKTVSISSPSIVSSLNFEINRLQDDFQDSDQTPPGTQTHTTRDYKPSPLQARLDPYVYEEEEADSVTDTASVKDDGYSDSCSLYADSEQSVTESLDSSVMKYQYENGRRYHNYRAGRYMLPNDEWEQDRMDMLHHLFLMLTGERLFECPLTDNPQKVLDLGTGTGNWAIDFGDLFPSAEVWGSDLSPIQPDFVPPNVKFEIDDIEDDWLWPKDNFDLIHCRTLVGSIKDWRKLIRTSLEHIKPGGYMEIQECDVCNPLSPDGRVPLAWAHYNELLREASVLCGSRLDVTQELKGLMEEVGFVDVQEIVYPVPHGPWSRDKHMKEIGKWSLHVFNLGTEAFALAPFTRVLGMKVEEADAIIKAATDEIMDHQRNRFYINTHFIYGRKPDRAVAVESSSDSPHLQGEHGDSLLYDVSLEGSFPALYHPSG
ncbi:S-adenosyl-L-methionine-dependent methyltransferase [Ascobolus immersus RN42]|uniref:S-adenosyl-L-methionine-dependent methyltransferase n=1 Tax=Ascobolus immersus RN42 TaxID=1160509 RepID=A0A3N4H958_ASCIM|nr:S-adenosyl-L-methionine-dependent methyltransferase [Ascobolus immersus RN42]